MPSPAYQNNEISDNKVIDTESCEDRYNELFDKYQQLSQDKWITLVSVITNAALVFVLIGYACSNRCRGTIQYKQIELDEEQPLD